MIVEPERYVDDFRAAGCDRITFHFEATPHAQRLLTHIRDVGAKAGHRDLSADAGRDARKTSSRIATRSW